MFELKKIIGFLLMPLPLGLGLATLGLLLGALRRRPLGVLALLAGWAVLALASNRGLAARLTASLENTYAPAPVANATAASWPTDLRKAGFIAVLGGGHGDAPAMSAGQRLSQSARARLTEGVRLALALPDAWLVVSGPRNTTDDDQNPPPPTHARVLADAAVELGFPRARIVEIDSARDTAEETMALRRLAGDDTVALVTSAWHMPRAMRLSEEAGLRAFPCPADYLGGRDAEISPFAWVTWDAESLANCTRAWREYVGRAWAAMTSPRKN
ncbi:MAG: hypothetical protein RLZZ50_1107 [Verrucomicrobiota bacterium]